MTREYLEARARRQKHIEDVSMKLLLEQRINSIYDIGLFDVKRVNTKGRAVIGSFSDYEKHTGDELGRDIEGITVKHGGITLILYNDRINNKRRTNFTLAHELGHVLLGHGKSEKVTDAEANEFAAAFLIPAPLLAYLDAKEGRKLTPKEMTVWFCASETVCRRRRERIDSGIVEIDGRYANYAVKLFEPASEII